MQLPFGSTIPLSNYSDRDREAPTMLELADTTDPDIDTTAEVAAPADGTGLGPCEDLLHDERLTAAGLLFEVAAGLEAALGRQIAGHGLALSEFEVLLRLVRSPGGQLRMSDLARQVNLSSSGLTRLADRLEARGLLERRVCPTDGRGSNALVTAEGRTVMAAVLPGHVALVERWLTSTLEPAQLQALTGALRAVRAGVRPDAEAGARTGVASDPA